MQLQKFVGESMPVVLSNLKEALGSDAIILANRRVGDHIEIIATGSLDEKSIDNAKVLHTDKASAVDESGHDSEGLYDDEQYIEPQSNSSTSSGSDLIDPFIVEEAVSDKQARASVEIPYTDTEFEIQSEEAFIQPSEPPLTPSDTSQGLRDDDGIGKPSAPLNTTAMTNAIALKVSHQIKKELANKNQVLLQRMMQLEASLWGEKDPVKSTVLDLLLKAGIGAELAVTLVSRVKRSSSLDEAIRMTLADLAKTLPVASDSTLQRPGITFVTGPNGAGKTTTLLKLAAQKAAESGSDSVVLICADAKRIGVFESLAAHGNALGVSVVCASSENELKELLAFYTNKELVLVDQPYTNQLFELDIPEAQAVDVNARSVRHLLVLPATMQASVAEIIVTDFSKHPTARCVITNLDRPCRVGELFNTIIRNNLRISYWSEGRDIHQPLNKASASMLVAAAMAMSKKLVHTDDDKYLRSLIQPRFSSSDIPMFSNNR